MAGKRKRAGWIGTVCTVILLVMMATMKKRQHKALKLRRKALETGVRYGGRIMDAGTEMETEECETTDENGQREVRRIRVPNYWIDVEYSGSGTANVKCFHAIHFSKSMERFIGCSVDVYEWKEWSEFMNKYTNALKDFFVSCK